MHAAPRLSVVIPHLNEPDNLRRCLLSLDAERADGIPFEIIVVDNGSAERPDAVCSSFAGVSLEYELVPGPGPARNRGANAARSELLAFIDADCVAQRGWVRAIVEFMAGNPDVDVVGGDIGILMADPERPTSIELYESIYSYRARLYVENHGFAATGNMAVRTRVFRSVGPFGGISTMEDTEWGRRATALGHRLAYLPQAKVFTPSCRSFAELARRWDRHVAHEFRKVGDHPAAMLRWLAGGVMVGVSPLVEAFRILFSDRVSGSRSRLFALACLIRVRLYRARLMFDLALHRNATSLVEDWNREKT
ncbi:glycosyltransferase family 2 protein [Ensifer sp. IC3342]|nr:glycosyltransferase family 2 protein [Ensifer sp. BRP08]MCA1448750.1 glycosyltransferase family 2 protein [Ensifer sp. IC3342]